MKKSYYLLLILSFVFSTNTAYSQKKKGKTTRKQTIENIKKPVIKYGIASYYASSFQNSKTSTGDSYDEELLTAACNVLPVNTWIKVTNLKNEKTVIVKINDRLHPKNKRLVDLSKSAAKILGFLSAGITKVKVEVLPDFDPMEGRL